jgi:hypothetical protein
MHSKNMGPISWDLDLGMYIESSSSYTGAHTKKSGRIASDIAVQHFIARQLEIIALSLSVMNTQTKGND